MRPKTVEDVKKGGCSSPKALQKAAEKRVLKAETLLYRALELMEKAQAEISVIGTGLNQNYSKISKIREDVKTQMYDLERCRESGHCTMDDTIPRKS
jgi:ABC-type enterochelin transport system substrate-binding protein